MWLSEAAAAGSTKMRVKMNQALALAKLFDPGEVDWALGHAAVHSRFAEADLASILDHHAGARTGALHLEHRAGEDHSLTQGTSAWAGLGQPDQNVEGADDVNGEVIAVTTRTHWCPGSGCGPHRPGVRGAVRRCGRPRGGRGWRPGRPRRTDCAPRHGPVPSRPHRDRRVSPTRGPGSS